MGSGGIGPIILNLESFSPQAALSWEKGPTVPIEPIGEPHNRSGRFGEEVNILLLPGAERRFLNCTAYSVVTIPTELSWRLFGSSET